MNFLAATILLSIALNSPGVLTAPTFESCSCSADDNSCAASVTCSGGCFAFCPTNGCRAMCTDDDFGGSSGSYRSDMMTARVNLRLKGSNSREVSAELARVTSMDVVFIPWTAGASVDLEATDEPLWNVLETLSRSGRLRIGGDDFSNLQTVRRALLYGERMSVCVRGASVKRFVQELRYLTGLDIRVTSGNQQTKVNFTAKEVNFDEIVAQVSELTGARITVR